MNEQQTTNSPMNQPVRNYKDSIFRMLFSDKKELLALYNALNQSNYTNPDVIEVKTLSNAIYVTIKNDIAFLLYDQLCLYEHQSTFNPNIPLRDLLYVADEYQALLVNESIYSHAKLCIPSPEFIVLYNGIEKVEDICELRLSDLYENPERQPKLELIATQININLGHNEELMSRCKTLKEYAIYVDKVRMYTKQYPLEEAVEKAVQECIHNKVLKDFLQRQRSEAKKVTIYEFDQELYEKTIRAESKAEGKNELLTDKVKKKLAKNKTVEEIAEELEESVENIQSICKKINFS